MTKTEIKHEMKNNTLTESQTNEELEKKKDFQIYI